MRSLSAPKVGTVRPRRQGWLVAPPSLVYLPAFPCWGEVAEWSIAHAWKACLGESLTRVRIPLSPPSSPLRTALVGGCLTSACKVRPISHQSRIRESVSAWNLAC